ncbi:hypothetical protein IFM89_004396 [Coptis chinensis]|uniref:DUF4283 domain-containing protein n=1 Tax=Coptis chinensis TaxID=261450 RepID=A0A835I012_9MAGN|nr:hypothetical protein IFM89_004396 [Coptis chinensis]
MLVLQDDYAIQSFEHDIAAQNGEVEYPPHFTFVDVDEPKQVRQQVIAMELLHLLGFWDRRDTFFRRFKLLKFIALEIDCLNVEDVTDERLTVAGKMYGGYPVNLENLGEELHHIWQTKGNITFELLSREHVRIHFEKAEEYNHVLEHGPWVVHGYILSIKKWKRVESIPVPRGRVEMDIKERLTKDKKIQMETGNRDKLNSSMKSLSFSASSVELLVTTSILAAFTHNIAYTWKQTVTISGMPQKPRYEEIPATSSGNDEEYARKMVIRGKQEKNHSYTTSNGSIEKDKIQRSVESIEHGSKVTSQRDKDKVQRAVENTEHGSKMMSQSGSPTVTSQEFVGPVGQGLLGPKPSRPHLEVQRPSGQMVQVTERGKSCNGLVGLELADQDRGKNKISIGNIKESTTESSLSRSLPLPTTPSSLIAY